MPQYYVPAITNSNYGTIDPSQFSRTGSAYSNPDFLKLYLAQLDQQTFSTLFDENGAENSIFGDSSNIFGSTPSSTSSIFGGTGNTALPTDLGGALSATDTGNSQYLELIARSNLIGKTVQALNPSTKQVFTGKVTSVSVDNGILLIEVNGIKVPPENLLKVME